MKWMLALLGAMWAGAAGANPPSPCLIEYRKSYMEYSHSKNAAYADAAELYAIYFDHASGLAVGQSEDQRRAAEIIYKKMNDGSLCRNFIYTFTMSKAAALAEVVREMQKQGVE